MSLLLTPFLTIYTQLQSFPIFPDHSSKVIKFNLNMQHKDTTFKYVLRGILNCSPQVRPNPDPNILVLSPTLP